MISKITKRMHAGGEGGFTLIELLVVIIIIAILAAIAIPMYLSQRQKGWRATVQSDLRNGAVAAEAYYTNGQTYVGLTHPAGTLEANGFNPSTGVTLTVDASTLTEYCLEASHSSNAADVWHIGNRAADTGAPQNSAC